MLKTEIEQAMKDIEYIIEKKNTFEIEFILKSKGKKTGRDMS